MGVSISGGGVRLMHLPQSFGGARPISPTDFQIAEIFPEGGRPKLLIYMSKALLTTTNNERDEKLCEKDNGRIGNEKHQTSSPEANTYDTEDTETEDEDHPDCLEKAHSGA